MQLLIKLAALGGAVALTGCASPKPTAAQTDAPDGFYIEAAAGKSPTYTLEVLPAGSDQPRTFRIQEYTGFVPQRVLVFDASGKYFLQIDGRAAAGWSKEGIILVVNRKAYTGLTKSGQATSATRERVGQSASISLSASTREEAERVASALKRRYSLPVRQG